MDVQSIKGSTTYRWTYSNVNAEAQQGDTALKKIEALKNDNVSYLHQDNAVVDDIELITLGTEDNTITQNTTDRSKSIINNSASTKYEGNTTKTIQVQLNADGTLINNNEQITNLAFIEFDFINDNSQTSNPFANSKAQCFNRVSGETRNRFEKELEQLEENIDTKLSEMSKSEVMLLNHFGGNVFIAEDGKLYRQPSTTELLEGIRKWQLIEENSLEYKVRQEAIKRLNEEIVDPPTTPEDPETPEEIPEEADFSVISTSANDAFEKFYNDTMPLASVIAVTNKMDDDMPDPTTNDLVSAMLEANGENEIKNSLNNAEYIATYYPNVQNNEINTLISETILSKFDDQLAQIVSNLDLKQYKDQKLAIGVADKQVSFDAEFAKSTFQVGSNNYNSFKMSEESTQLVTFYTDGEETPTATAAAIDLSDEGTMYLIPKTAEMNNMSFNAIYEMYIDLSTNIVNATQNDALTLPYLDFTKTMVYKEEDEDVAIVDVQRFSINAETATTQVATTQSANGLSLDFTNGNFVVLLVGKDQNKPYYGVMIDDDETKEKMFVSAA